MGTANEEGVIQMGPTTRDGSKLCSVIASAFTGRKIQNANPRLVDGRIVQI